MSTLQKLILTALIFGMVLGFPQNANAGQNLSPSIYYQASATIDYYGCNQNYMLWAPFLTLPSQKDFVRYGANINLPDQIRTQAYDIRLDYKYGTSTSGNFSGCVSAPYFKIYLCDPISGAELGGAQITESVIKGERSGYYIIPRNNAIKIVMNTGNGLRYVPGSHSGYANVGYNSWFEITLQEVPQAASPSFFPESGTFLTQQSVTITSATNGATIHYTTDGSEPTNLSPVYSSPILVAANTTIKACAIAPGTTSSDIASAIYRIRAPMVTKEITYYDTENRLLIRFGSDSEGWQYGQIFYDPIFGKPIKIQRALNSPTNWVTIKEYGYDSDGRLNWERGNLPHTTSYAYDALDRIIQMRLPNGSTTLSEWNDKTVTITDPNQNKREMTYDKLDRLIKLVEHPEPGINLETHYTYDTYDDPFTQKTESHLVKLVNPRIAATQYTYDNLGRLIRMDYPQDGSNPMTAEVYRYDNVGNLVAKVMGSKTKTIQYEFFAGYRVQKVIEPDGRTVNYTYDPNDNITSQITSNGVSYTYAYNARNQLTSLNAVLNGISFGFSYDYDVFGRMTSISYPNRTSPVTYSYDELDRLQGIPGFVNSCAYDLDNKLTRMTYANGVANTYSYDVNDRPITIAAGSLLNLNYGYDPVGNITRINSDYYGYDGLNRLTWYGSGSTPGSGTGSRWSYDGAGNMASKTKYLNGASQGVTSFGYDLANRLWSMGSISYTNDQYGNRIQKSKTGESFNYGFDGENRLSQVAKNSSAVLQNIYDGNGMRVKKAEGGKTTYYIYNGANPMMEYSPTDGTYLYRFYAGKTAIAEEKAGVVEFYHKDHLGSTRVVSNAAGAKIAEYKFAPYGEKEVASGDGTEYGFTDKAEDASTGLKYFGARFYDPEVGRFISMDPAKQGINYYAYCNNNPLAYTDPDGRCPVFVVTGIAGAIIGGAYGAYTSYTTTGQVNWGTVAKDAATGGLIGAGAGALAGVLYAGTTAAITIATESGVGVWALGAAQRGQVIERALGGMCSNFPTIDKFVNGANGIASSITSIKSMDLGAASYQKGNAVFNTIMSYANKLADFGTTAWNGVTVKVGDATQRVLQLVIPEGATAAQQAQIQAAIKAAAEAGVQVIVTTAK